ncbi:MAG: DNA-processing protein DprA [Alphaproteobacteria bacterium]|nr:DNA-processing protein DprA [Alphaproteobacteria bacterium]
MGDDAYRPQRQAAKDATLELSAIGNPQLMKDRTVGIFGTRNASVNSRLFTITLTRELGATGYVIDPGLALGIDAAAHERTLVTGTIAAVAGRVNAIYPPEHAGLKDQIATEGLIVGEARVDITPQARHFPSQNLVIASLSFGVLVIKASKNSGSLIPARCASQQGCEVFAVPEPSLDPRAAGTNLLLRDGATRVEGADDLISALPKTWLEEPGIGAFGLL